MPGRWWPDWKQSADLAARSCARQQQQPVLRHQCVSRRLSRQPREDRSSSAPPWAGSTARRSWRCSILLFACESIAAARLAVCAVRPAAAGGFHRAHVHSSAAGIIGAAAVDRLHRRDHVCADPGAAARCSALPGDVPRTAAGMFTISYTVRDRRSDHHAARCGTRPASRGRRSCRCASAPSC